MGIEIQERKDNRPKKKNDKIVLLFVGALGVKMNLDALVYFQEKFYETIKSLVNHQVEVYVVGSNPSSKIIKLCKQEEWILQANVTDNQLASLYQMSDLAILPFPYTTGSKLKLLNSIANNLPFIATTNLSHQVDASLPLCLFSDEPEEWAAHINKLGSNSFSERDYQQMRALANHYTWETVTKDLYHDIKKKI
ncbi:MAG: glycosyltransferase family 4 protein [Anaerolineaceae bacterium]|nr:glycosyltransferase family 4 protein [Anaerolineaceae bacterium]